MSSAAPTGPIRKDLPSTESPGRPVTGLSRKGTPSRTGTEATADRNRARRSNRVIVGLVLGALALGWLGYAVGVDLPWQYVLPSSLTLVGVALLVTAMLGRHRAALAFLGLPMLLASFVLGANPQQFAVPAAELTFTPATSEWPVQARRSLGNVRIDLTRHQLPDAGTLAAEVGAGNITLLLPQNAALAVSARVRAGTVLVDGRRVASGVNLSWSSGDPSAEVAASIVVVAGEVAVRHESRR